MRLVAVFFIFLISPVFAADQETTQFNGPDWLTISRLYNGRSFVIGGYPLEAQFGSGGTPLAQALVGAVQIPSEMKGAHHSAGVAGYARTLSKEHMAVGVHGFGGVMADGGQAEAAHFLTTNCGAQWCPPNSGFHAADNFIIEADINIMKTADGSAPKGNAFGLIFFGAGETVPQGSFQAIRVDSPGVFQKPVLAWKEALWTADGAATVGVNLGTMGEQLPGRSQPIQFRSRSETKSESMSQLDSDKNGNITLRSASGSVRVAGTAISIDTSQTPSSSNASCDAGRIQWDSDNIYICVAPNRWRRSRLTDW